MYMFLKGLVDLLKSHDTVTDHTVFRMHYRYSVALIALCSVLVGANQYFGDPISCKNTSALPGGMLNTYCWIHGTWTIAELNTNRWVTELSHPGMGRFNPRVHTKIHHRYYQWVPIMLALSALAFYVPRQIWKAAEGGAIHNMVQGLKFPNYRDKKADQKAVDSLFHYVSYDRRRHQVRAYTFIVCEVLNLAGIITQWFLADALLNGEFTTYGSRFFAYYRGADDESAVNPADLIFPKMGSCSFKQYGRSGSIESVETMCILPQNIVNEKIALVIWLWFIILGILTLLSILFRVLLLFVPPVRK